MHDLEIRGAGEVLGESQSGEMQEVGFNLYADMLDHAVRSLKAGREPDLSQPFEVITEVNLHFPALLPASYCADVHERLVLYKRFANCDSAERIEAMQEELVDRFGDLPPAARALIESHRLRILGRALGVARVDANPEFIQLQFAPHPPLDPAAVLKLVQKQRWKLTGPTKLRVERVTSELPGRALSVRQVLEALATTVIPANPVIPAKAGIH
jgi:transcription-repair coupling factor (superfamily II helicase)